MNMAKDPVCGMEVNVAEAAGESIFKGTTYFFCAPICKRDFDKEPERYVVDAPKQDEDTSLRRKGN
jgi:YHS domain-containing protein